MYSLESPRWGDSNEYTTYILMMKIGKIPKISLNIFFYLFIYFFFFELSDEFLRDSKTSSNCECGRFLTSTTIYVFEQKYEKYQSFFLSENF